MKKLLFIFLLTGLLFSPFIFLNAQDQENTSSLEEVLNSLQALISGWVGRLSSFSELSETEKKTEIKNIGKEVGEARELTSTAQNLISPITSPTLKRDLCLRSVGEDVRELQKYLNQSGFVVSQEGPGSIGKETTYYGNLTAAAVREFQKARGISSTGCVGSETREILSLVNYAQDPRRPSDPDYSPCHCSNFAQDSDVEQAQEDCYIIGGYPQVEYYDHCVYNAPWSAPACGGTCGRTVTCNDVPGISYEIQDDFPGTCLANPYNPPIFLYPGGGPAPRLNPNSN